MAWEMKSKMEQNVLGVRIVRTLVLGRQMEDTTPKHSVCGVAAKIGVQVPHNGLSSVP